VTIYLAWRATHSTLLSSLLHLRCFHLNPIRSLPTSFSGQEHASKSIGRPSIGGPFSLQTHRNEPFTEQDLLGNWTLIYFGFTNCPDICPEELDKMGAAVDLVDAHRKERVLPIFVSVDPARDSIEQVNKYVAGEWTSSGS
jgi:cytochrome oxidase Cu insertion factor (SCO1/SenC/PrrC family)